MRYLQYNLLIMTFLCLAGTLLYGQNSMIVSAGTTVKISCSTRVIVGTTILRPAVNSTGTIDSTVNLAMVFSAPAPTPTVAVGTGTVLMAAGCATGFREDQTSDWSVNLYPNPAANEVFMDMKGFSGEVQFVLIDISGKTVVSENWATEGEEIRSLDVSSLSSGLYLYRLTNGIHSVSGKVIKE